MPTYNHRFKLLMTVVKEFRNKAYQCFQMVTPHILIVLQIRKFWYWKETLLVPIKIIQVILKTIFKDRNLKTKNSSLTAFGTVNILMNECIVYSYSAGIVKNMTLAFFRLCHAACGILSSPTRDWTLAPYIRSLES